MNTIKEITLANIKKEFKGSIKRDFAFEIEKYISEKEPQKYIKKAMQSKLTSDDCKYLFQIGNRKKGKYPYLFWLCCIYMTPLTAVAYYSKQIDKQLRKDTGKGFFETIFSS